MTYFICIDMCGSARFVCVPTSSELKQVWGACCASLRGAGHHLRPMRPGRIARRDCEYKRCGMANVFCGVQPKAGRHFTKATPDRSSPEFADYLLEIAVSYPEADTIRLVMDNLSSEPHESGGGPVRREDRRLVVGPVHSALYTQTRKLAEPSGDREQPVQPSVHGPAQTPLAPKPTARNKGMEPEDESRPGHHRLAVYTQKGTPQVRP